MKFKNLFRRKGTNPDDPFYLPEYLGISTLDKNSVKKTSNSIYAEYKWNSQLVYEYEIINKIPEIRFYMEGCLSGVMKGNNLKECFFGLLDMTRIIEDPIFINVSHKISSLGVYVLYPDKHQEMTFFFPAGYLLQLHLPLIDIGRDKLKAIKDLIVDRFQSTVMGEGESSIITATKELDFITETKPFLLVSFSFNKAIDIMHTLYEMKVFSKEKKYCPVLSELSTSINDFRLFTGRETDSYDVYTYMPHVLNTEELEVIKNVIRQNISFAST